MARANGENGALVQQLGNTQAAKAPKTIEDLIKDMAPAMQQAMPKHMDINRFTRIALTQIRTNPKLRECTAPSLLAAILQSAQLGLELGLLGQAYLVPFKNNKNNTMEVQFVIGYKGMIDLARRSGHIQSISAHEVYQNDFFELTYGLNEDLRHIPWHVRNDESFDEPGDIRGAYMVAHFKDGGHFVHYMPKHEIEQHKKRSKASTFGPWVSDYIEMCKKTVVRSGWKWLPISIEIAEQVAQSDETVKTDYTENADYIDLSHDDYSEGSAATESAITIEPEVVEGGDHESTLGI